MTAVSQSFLLAEILRFEFLRGEYVALMIDGMLGDNLGIFGELSIFPMISSFSSGGCTSADSV